MKTSLGATAFAQACPYCGRKAACIEANDCKCGALARSSGASINVCASMAVKVPLYLHGNMVRCFASIRKNVRCVCSSYTLVQPTLDTGSLKACYCIVGNP